MIFARQFFPKKLYVLLISFSFKNERSVQFWEWNWLLSCFVFVSISERPDHWEISRFLVDSGTDWYWILNLLLCRGDSDSYLTSSKVFFPKLFLFWKQQVYLITVNWTRFTFLIQTKSRSQNMFRTLGAPLDWLTIAKA